MSQGFHQECLRGGGGSEMGGGFGAKKNQIFKFLVPKMAYFNWNDSKIWDIFLFSLPTGGDIPSLVLSGGRGGGERTPPPPGGNPVSILLTCIFILVILNHLKIVYIYTTFYFIILSALYHINQIKLYYHIISVGPTGSRVYTLLLVHYYI